MYLSNETNIVAHVYGEHSMDLPTSDLLGGVGDAEYHRVHGRLHREYEAKALKTGEIGGHAHARPEWNKDRDLV